MNDRTLKILSLSLILFFLMVDISFSADGELKKSGGRYQPSENKGRTGSYECQTKKKEYKYWVYVPSSYSDKNPAGLYIFFHGQGGGGGAKYFGCSNYLEQHNLIGINMEYTDGQNQNDSTGKEDAAEQAVLQTMADYKIIHGRGFICSFSGGGIIHQLYFNQHGKGTLKRRDAEWSFCHNSLYGSNFWGSAKGGMPMSWLVSLHENERNMGQPTLGTTQPQRAAELLPESLRSETIDVVYLYLKGAGHGITGRDVEVSMMQFRRSDLALAPFIYAPDYPEGELKGSVESMNSLDYGKAETSLKALAGNAQLAADLRKKVEDLQARLNKRIDDVIALSKELAQNDPILCEAYSKYFLKQIAGHSRAADVKASLDPGIQKFNAGGLKKIKDDFIRDAVDMVDMPSGKVKAKKKESLEKTIKAAGAQSQCGIMAQAFLDCIEVGPAGASDKKK